MAEEKKHHHLFHGNKEEEGSGSGSSETDSEKEEKHHKHLEQLGAFAAGAYPLHEKHKPAKKDPENNAHEHKMSAATVAVGSAFHERHEKKVAKKRPRNLLYDIDG